MSWPKAKSGKPFPACNSRNLVGGARGLQVYFISLSIDSVGKKGAKRLQFPKL